MDAFEEKAAMAATTRIILSLPVNFSGGTGFTTPADFTLIGPAEKQGLIRFRRFSAMVPSMPFLPAPRPAIAEMEFLDPHTLCSLPYNCG